MFTQAFVSKTLKSLKKDATEDQSGDKRAKKTVGEKFLESAQKTSSHFRATDGDESTETEAAVAIVLELADAIRTTREVESNGRAESEKPKRARKRRSYKSPAARKRAETDTVSDGDSVGIDDSVDNADLESDNWQSRFAKQRPVDTSRKRMEPNQVGRNEIGCSPGNIPIGMRKPTAKTVTQFAEVPGVNESDSLARWSPLNESAELPTRQRRSPGTSGERALRATPGRLSHWCRCYRR